MEFLSRLQSWGQICALRSPFMASLALLPYRYFIDLYKIIRSNEKAFLYDSKEKESLNIKMLNQGKKDNCIHKSKDHIKVC